MAGPVLEGAVQLTLTLVVDVGTTVWAPDLPGGSSRSLTLSDLPPEDWIGGAAPPMAGRLRLVCAIPSHARLAA